MWLSSCQAGLRAPRVWTARHVAAALHTCFFGSQGMFPGDIPEADPCLWPRPGLPEPGPA